MKKNRKGQVICTACREPIVLSEADIDSIKDLGKELARDFFNVKYKDVDLYCNNCPPVEADYRWKLKYRGVIPIQVKDKALHTNQGHVSNPHKKGSGKVPSLPH